MSESEFTEFYDFQNLDLLFNLLILIILKFCKFRFRQLRRSHDPSPDPRQRHRGNAQKMRNIMLGHALDNFATGV